MEKSCQNCKYYLQHYYINALKFRAAFYGHCYKRRNKIVKSCFFCDSWVQTAITEESMNKSITNILNDMSKSLNQIVLILDRDSLNIRPDIS